ncbi:hypothetical protein Esi_0014_0215 [Ectocarpus siliculosus]|uniref:EF-hand domain-containing protein n=1 Tax=Ectocarpus siliculosus TaxID=2880 RepID=D8LF25_ECTSI|nr:hypothetical protein Esi_0014_0215 [Ectocarpus siliculosus]|eukprot:CBN79845.1 hypothetical protein Esi_0014_0215 [Ectocarpus siliculosus]
MAFFGLTALGPQNSFQVALLDFSYLDVFTALDMEKAFNIVDHQKRGYIHSDQVEAFLTELYHGKPIACDLARFMEKKKSLEGQENRVTLDDIQSTMAQLRKEAKYVTRGVFAPNSELEIAFLKQATAPFGLLSKFTVE